jgi:bifunctional non-homologous end joining protein LigD
MKRLMEIEVSQGRFGSRQVLSGQQLLRKKINTKPAFVEPMKCRLVEDVPEEAGWLFEIKFDGIRALAVKSGTMVTLYSRARNVLNERFPEIVDALKAHPVREAIWDGEIVALHSSGKSSFELLQASRIPGVTRPPIVYYMFDLLRLDGTDLKPLPLWRRREALTSIGSGKRQVLRLSALIEGKPRKILEAVRRQGLEGLIAKDRESRYEAGLRTGSWRKIKCVNQQELVIGGYTAPRGARSCFGAILTGYHENGRFLFASKVGAGFDERWLRDLFARFKTLRQDECPFDDLKVGRFDGALSRAEMSRCSWVKPRLVCEIRFTEWTQGGHLRHPVFLGLRDDKKAASVRREKVVSG